ncbi:hypothetical protein BGZ65_011805 [Modicella reniformis]|uniref:Uncharacterized protein n=1 Tax=Modicella reniformis TaxID=1440133 RepID=A0A9P6MDC8_9FUNG|nr:hypothetical protein BGZ65_011805 [Modicella reniformis]
MSKLRYCGYIAQSLQYIFADANMAGYSYLPMRYCLTCQTSTTAHYTVKDLDGYKLVCLSYGQTWKQINLPSTTTTTTVSPTLTTTAGSSSSGINMPDGDDKSINVGHNALSNGAIVGIVVSVVALVVALSVAGYVWNRRRQDSAFDVVDQEEQFKYRRGSDDQRDAYLDSAALPQYTGIPTLPPIAQVSNLRVMNPDSEDEGGTPTTLNSSPFARRHQPASPSFEVRRGSSPGWRRGSFDDD